MADDEATPQDENEQTQPEQASANSEETTTTTEERATEEPAVVTAASDKWQENAKAAKQANKEKFGRIKDFFRGYWARKKWTLPVTVVALLILLLGVPVTRYPILGSFWSKQVQGVVVDSTTGKPVSGATIIIGASSSKTGANGLFTIKEKLGKHHVSITKKYYKSYASDVFVGVLGAPSALRANIVATGRQVPITVLDKITGKPLANVSITAGGTDAKTDKDGKATIVLPTASTTQKANLQLAGYNTTAVNITVTDQVISTNSFGLVASGKLYFLSNLSGKIDVVKTNLDGTDRQTVLAGTGKEDPYTTALLASRDWKYLALLSKRDGNQGVYLINTSNDQVTNIDGGSSTATFTLVGWSDDTFVYQVNRSNIQNWQSGSQALKSYAADSSKLYSIDQNQGEGTGQSDYGYNSFGTVSILDNELVYTKSWYGNNGHLTGKNDSFISVRPDGTAKRDVKDFPVPDSTQYGYTISSTPYESYGVYLQVPSSDGTSNTYYSYEASKLSQRSDVTDDIYFKTYPTFLISPSDKSTFWSEVRDNKNTLFIGDENGQNGKQIASLSAYTPYGWFTDNYLLVSENGSELFIMSADGSKPPVKISDYYKPQLTYRGYGGGYGGI